MSNPIAGLFTWKLHGDGKTLKPGEVVEPDERLTWPRTAEIGAQHVIAMFGATFLVPILTGFDPSTTLFFTAMSTALFLLINKNMLPSYLGSSFGFIAPIAAVASAHKGLAVASFGIMVTGILLALIGVLVHYAGAKWIDIIMPPVVNGAIVAIIGFNLAPSVWNNFKVAPDTAIVTLVAVLLVAGSSTPSLPNESVTALFASVASLNPVPSKVRVPVSTVEASVAASVTETSFSFTSCDQGLNQT